MCVTILVARMIAIDHIDVRSRDEETRNKKGHAQGENEPKTRCG
jgi:hypothetical protein